MWANGKSWFFSRCLCGLLFDRPLGGTYLTSEFMMNLDLEELLAKSDIAHELLAKKYKVKLLTRWVQEFPELVASARRQELHKEGDRLSVVCCIRKPRRSAVGRQALQSEIER
jgi:hypothetical protein